MTHRDAAAPDALRLILFDCDGTLVDSQHMIVAAMREAHEAHGVPAPAREHILSIVGLSLPEAFTVLARGDRAYPTLALAQGYRDAFIRLRDTLPPEPMFPLAWETLDRLRRADDLLLGMVTGKARRGVARVLAAHRMEGWFTTIQTADDAPSKPHPGMVLQAMTETGIAPDRTVVVGDTTYDIEMAKAAGAFAVGVAWGYHPVADLRSAGADLVVERFELVPQAIDDLVRPLADAGMGRKRHA